MLAVTGASGSGKITLLHVLGLVPPSAGNVAFRGAPVGTRAGGPRTGTALVLRNYGLLASLTAEEIVSVADLAERLIEELSGVRCSECRWSERSW